MSGNVDILYDTIYIEVYDEIYNWAKNSLHKSDSDAKQLALASVREEYNKEKRKYRKTLEQQDTQKMKEYEQRLKSNPNMDLSDLMNNL